MKIFAISDLHLSSSCEKPMDIFGEVWDGHFDKIKKDWIAKVHSEDIVLIGGDISWAMTLDDALIDLNDIASLPGKKIMIRGNHDYWWSGIGKLRNALPTDFFALQNDAVKLGKFVFAGTRGWTVPENFKQQDEQDKKLYERELMRLEISLKNAAKLREEGDKVIVLIHYPPFNSRYEDSGFTKLIREYKADTVIYGHLHGKDSRTNMVQKVAGINYYLTSCDKLGNELLNLSEAEEL